MDIPYEAYATKNCHSNEPDYFNIVTKVGKLAYRLKLLSSIRIYSIVSVAQLEPVPSQPNPYNRQRNTPRYSVDETDSLEDDDFLEDLADNKLIKCRQGLMILHGAPSNSTFLQCTLEASY